jgi:putative alpha-1,2-mannosidase
VNESVRARPGYFDITLVNGIRTEMTTTNHTALYRMTFPEAPVTPNTTLAPHILVELTDLPQTRSQGNVSVDAQTGRVTGSGRFEPSFGIGTYVSFFCLDFSGSKPTDAGVWVNERATSDVHSLRIDPGDERYTPSPRPAGAWVQFAKPERGNQVLARVGMSFISEAQACANAEREVPGWDFDGVVDAAEAAWRAKLDVISIKDGGVDEVLLRAFWSGVYRTMISPQDYTGENPGWESDEPYYDSFYCIWDSYRSIHPFLTLVDPHSQTLMVRSLLDIYRHTGYLPDCRMSHCKGTSPLLYYRSPEPNTSASRLHPGRLQRRHRDRRRIPQKHHRRHRLEPSLRSRRKRRRSRARKLGRRRYPLLLCPPAHLAPPN